MPATMCSNLGDPNLQCGDSLNFRSSEEQCDQGYIGVVRKHCVVGAESGA